MLRSLSTSIVTSLSILALSLGLTACLTGDEPSEDIAARESTTIPLLPVEPRPALDEAGNPIAGTLVFDTSEGRLDITDLVPDRPREFASRTDFHRWVASTLNAKLAEHEDRELSTTLDYSAPTTVRYDRRLEAFVVVDDPVAAIIGGTEGFVVIAGEEVCTSRTAACSREAGLAPPEQTNRTLVPWIVSGRSPSGSIKIVGTTWNAFSSFLQWIGSNTIQTGGGLTFGFVPCWPLGPSWCVTRTGSNFLATSYTSWLQQGPPVFTGAAAASNTYAIMTSQVVFHWTPLVRADRTCATHFASSRSSSISLISGFLLPFLPYNC